MRQCVNASAQVEIRAGVIGSENVHYLQDGVNVLIQKFEGQPALVQFPKSVVMEIAVRCCWSAP